MLRRSPLLDSSGEPQHEVAIMVTHAMRQAGSSLFSLAIVIVGVFLLLRLFGDPTPNLIPDGTPEQVAELRSQLGLSESIPRQLWTYLSGLAQGDFGNSYYTNRPVFETVWARFITSAKLITGGITVAILFGIPLGILA